MLLLIVMEYSILHRYRKHFRDIVKERRKLKYHEVRLYAAKYKYN